MSYDYKIPDSELGFYATGVYNTDKNTTKTLELLIKPIEKYCISALTKNLPHISCRYLGYHDKVSQEQIKKLVPQLKKVYSKFLPIDYGTDGVYGSWETQPEHKKKLLMLRIVSPKLVLLHEEFLKITKQFHVFSTIEGENFFPHITLAHLKEEFENSIPPEVIDYVNNSNTVTKLHFQFLSAYIYTQQGMQQIS